MQQADRTRAPLTIPTLALPKALPDLRAQVRAHLTGWSLPHLVDTAELCTSELVTNVITHVGEATPITLHLTHPGPHARLSVTDPDPRALPVLLKATPDAESGRGLTLLDALTLRWGVEQHGEGKTVWCELET
ncbi:ATP-binding protein [Streptomyces sp. NPDC048172]|uniref:ATP-binding protein n=1 Tax=Streptomyces sp. NPDC048172 TaxID=3365505 RepID=UPI00371F0BA6